MPTLKDYNINLKGLRLSGLYNLNQKQASIVFIQKTLEKTLNPIRSS
jgi:hypothetical protein